MRAATLFLLFSFILSSCSSPNLSKKLLHNIDHELKQNYKLEQCSLFAIYDLAKINKTNCLYAKDFGRIINEESYNKTFLKRFKARHKIIKDLDHETTIKINKIKSLVLKLNAKYNFLTKTESHVFKRSYNSKEHNVFDFISSRRPTHHNILELANLDKIINYIPLMVPEYQPIITSHYGFRKHPNHRRNKFHCGIDLKGRKSTPVYSSAEGRVNSVGRIKGYGNIIDIKHASKFRTRYAHLKRIHVKEGDLVLRGQKIGEQGNTGNSTGEHLHFEIWLNDKHINPFDFITHTCNY
jgi:murein DD-endopeptidase MepM/ murein hydrolase activator NlpD